MADTPRHRSTPGARFPLEQFAVLIEGAQEVQGAANGFGLLIEAVIRIEPQRDGDPALLLTYSHADAAWDVEVVPTAPIPE